MQPIISLDNMLGLSRTHVHCKVAADDPGLTGCVELADRETNSLLGAA